MQAHALAVPPGRRRHLWLALLIAASVATSLGFACAVPLAAFAAAGALTLSRRDALLLVAAVWLANQIVGFAVLGYPWTVNCIAWGVALGAVALLSTVAARGIADRLGRVRSVTRSVAAFLAAFVVYEGALFMVALVLGGSEDFTLAIIGRIFAVNAIGMAALFVANRLGTAIGLVAPVGLPLSRLERHA
jgi:hypothetical protein